MKKQLTILFMLVILFTSIAFAEEYIAVVSPHWDGFKEMISKWFDDKTESLYFVFMNNGKYRFDSGKKHEVSFTYAELFERMEKDSYTIGMIVLCIHNHHDDYGFSKQDAKIYGHLLYYGFTGSFCVYEHKGHRVIELIKRIRRSK